MNFGNTILNLRKKKQITQEELAAELGVTAAAVSKWENNCTLPDIMMLCALADYFEVTTDELLGRQKEVKYALIAAETQALGLKIAKIANKYGIVTHGIFDNFQDALAAAQKGSEINYILAGFRQCLTEEEHSSVKEPIRLHASISQEELEILYGFEMIFQQCL